MQNIIGTWVTGDDFFGRKQELEELKEIDRIKEQYNELTSQSKLCFNSFYERLKKYLSEPEYLAARKILYHLARKELTFEDIYPLADDLMPSKKKINKLLQRLIDENYIKYRNSCYSFVSPVLCDWWKNYIKWED